MSEHATHADVATYHIHDLHAGAAEVWKDLGHGSQILIAVFVSRDFAEQWVEWRVGRESRSMRRDQRSAEAEA